MGNVLRLQDGLSAGKREALQQTRARFLGTAGPDSLEAARPFPIDGDGPRQPPDWKPEAKRPVAEGGGTVNAEHRTLNFEP